MSISLIVAGLAHASTQLSRPSTHRAADRDGGAPSSAYVDSQQQAATQAEGRRTLNLLV